MLNTNLIKFTLSTIFFFGLILQLIGSIFLAPLSTLRRVRDPSQGGRPAFDSVLMFQVLILKTRYNWTFAKLCFTL
jgi:hypothetical protein